MRKFYPTIVRLGLIAGIASLTACASQPWESSSVKPIEYPGNCHIGQGQLVIPPEESEFSWTGKVGANAYCATAAVTVVPTDPDKPLPKSVTLFSIFRTINFGPKDLVANYTITQPHCH